MLGVSRSSHVPRLCDLCEKWESWAREICKLLKHNTLQSSIPAASMGEVVESPRLDSFKLAARVYYACGTASHSTYRIAFVVGNHDIT